MRSVSRGIDRIGVTFDDPTLVADAGLIVPATLMVRLGLEALVNHKVRLFDRVGGARPGRKVLTLIASILAGGTHIDHADRLRAGATHRVLPFRVMAPSTLGIFLRAFTFGHVRQLDAVVAETIRRAWSLGVGPGQGAMVIDMDSTICEVFGKAKQGVAYGYTRVLGYHPLLATWAHSGEVLHARLRKGSSQRGVGRFVEELVARVRRAGASGPLVLRADAGFFSYALVDTLNRLGVSWSITVIINPRIRACIEAIDESAWQTIFYPGGGEAQVAETTYITGNNRSLRLVVRRTRLGDPVQQALWPDWATTPSSPISTPRWSKSTSSTATTPRSSWPYVTSKKGRGSNTVRRGSSSPTRRGSRVRSSRTTSPVGPSGSVTSIPKISSLSPAPSALASSWFPDAWSTEVVASSFGSLSDGHGLVPSQAASNGSAHCRSWPDPTPADRRGRRR